MTSGFGFRINYAECIAEDERLVRFYSSDFARAVARACEGRPNPESFFMPELFVTNPEIADVSGLSKAEIRAMLVAVDYTGVGEQEAWMARVAPIYGAEEPGDRKAGNKLLESTSPDGLSTWAELWSFQETGARGRADRLRRAKVDLSRHKRNRAKYGN